MTILQFKGKTGDPCCSITLPDYILRSARAIISGDKDKLEVVFNYELSGTYESWSIQLTPKSRRINKHLTSLQVTGDDQSATSIRINLNDGEWQLMEIFRNDRVP